MKRLLLALTLVAAPAFAGHLVAPGFKAVAPLFGFPAFCQLYSMPLHLSPKKPLLAIEYHKYPAIIVTPGGSQRWNLTQAQADQLQICGDEHFKNNGLITLPRHFIADGSSDDEKSSEGEQITAQEFEDLLPYVTLASQIKDEVDAQKALTNTLDGLSMDQLDQIGNTARSLGATRVQEVVVNIMGQRAKLEQQAQLLTEITTDNETQHAGTLPQRKEIGAEIKAPIQAPVARPSVVAKVAKNSISLGAAMLVGYSFVTYFIGK